MIRCFFVFSLVLFFSGAAGQSRIRQSINTNWRFFKGDLDVFTIADPKTVWANVNIPHSYNTDDVLDDTPGYYRGNGWYRKEILIPASWKARTLYLFFEGVNQTAVVYVNGKLAGEHVGGYTAFRIKLNEFLNADSEENEIAIKVNNEFHEDIPPLTADFTFFGGIYRDVFLESYNPVHFNPDNYSSDGLFLTTPFVSETQAVLKVNGEIKNTTSTDQNVLITTTVFDQEHKEVTKQQTKLRVKAGETLPFQHNKLSVLKPLLWTPENPNLYSSVVKITHANTNETLDEMFLPVGLRWFSFTGDKGFFLNGKPYKIWGTSRHQDYPNIGNALPDAMHVRDVQLLKDMGGNFLRVAHYPQDPAILEACDRLGILASVEIPVVNTITESAAFTANTKHMLVEMIRQNFNHPSVIMWASMNEVLLRLPFAGDKPRQEKYFKNVNRLAYTLDSLTRKEDDTRVTMMAYHGHYDLYKRVGLVDIPMVAGWNLYQGWYGGNIDGFAAFLDNFHQEFSTKPVLVTEYGADGDPRVRGFSPQRFDKTIEYETFYHQVYIKAMAERAFVSGGLIWNLADFNSEIRAEAMPHVNNKGIVDGHRNPKDSYWLYQCYLSKDPIIKIGSRGWKLRSGTAMSEDSLFCRQRVEVFTNLQTEVTLINNGKVVGVKIPRQGIASFEVPFSNGVNRLESVSGKIGVRDFVEIDFVLQPFRLDSKNISFSEINVSLGDERFFIDVKLKQVWFPEKPYEKGSWGYVGGTVFSLPDKSRQPYGSDKNIMGTDYDPVFETQREGIEQFKLDVSSGEYEVTFHFAELAGGLKKEALVYNLGKDESSKPEAANNRKFDVVINGKKLIAGLSNANYLVPETAYSTTVNVSVMDNNGIVIEFLAIEGKTILNGLQIRRVH
jgi:beta-galactosidase